MARAIEILHALGVTIKDAHVSEVGVTQTPLVQVTGSSPVPPTTS